MTAPREPADLPYRQGAFMFALGMGYYAWRIAHEPALPVLVMVVGLTLGMWLLGGALAWLFGRLRFLRIEGDAGIVGIMAGRNGVSVGLYRRHVWLWKRTPAANPCTSGTPDRGLQ